MLFVYNFLSPGEVAYLSILLISLFSGFVFRTLPKNLREIACGVLGICLVYIACGNHIIHSLLVIIVSVVILQNVTFKISHFLVFLWCFGYLFIFRSPKLFHFAQPNEIANAVQLIVTLRLVGVAFEINKSQHLHHEIVKAKPEQLINLYNYKELTAINPSGFSIFMYAYCYAGLFTGPYYKFRTLQDMLEWPDTIAKPSDKLLWRRFQELPIYSFFFLLISYFFNENILRSSEFHSDEEYSMLGRLGIFALMFLHFRLRMYCGWILAECLCMSVNLGAYPMEAKSESGQGPTDLRAYKEWKQIKTKEGEERLKKQAKTGVVEPVENEDNADYYDYNTINNISIWGCEFTPTIREGMKSWNKTVQYWLAINIYKRCYGPKYLRTMMTMVVSAYWHGLYPGYYLAFASIPFAMLAESSLEVVVGSLGSFIPPHSLTLLRWILKMRVFETCAVAFLLKDFQTTILCWSSVNFIIHFICLSVILLAGLLKLCRVDYRSPVTMED